MDDINIAQAKKLVLHSQWLPSKKLTGSAVAKTLSAIEHLGYIQIDTISVVERAHNHTLWNRNPSYKNSHLDRLQKQGDVFEYWSHAAAYLPINDYRFCLRKMRETASGEGHWFSRDRKIMRLVLGRIEVEGPLRSKDFESKSGLKREMWDWKPAKRALEQLFMEGQLMTARREGFQKVYDLTENVLPSHVDTSEPSESEWARHLIHRFLNANGLGRPEEIAYLRKRAKPVISSVLENMREEGEVIEVGVFKTKKGQKERYFVKPNTMEYLSKPLMRKQVKILSPFDNLLIQRKRISKLFDYDYQIECYVPQSKRVYGYFCLPLLWDGELVGRVDCKADRTKNKLLIHSLFLEKSVGDMEKLIHHLTQALCRFAAFNGCSKLVFGNNIDSRLTPYIGSAVIDVDDAPS